MNGNYRPGSSYELAAPAEFLVAPYKPPDPYRAYNIRRFTDDPPDWLLLLAGALFIWLLITLGGE